MPKNIPSSIEAAMMWGVWLGQGRTLREHDLGVIMSGLDLDDWDELKPSKRKGYVVRARGILEAGSLSAPIYDVVLPDGHKAWKCCLSQGRDGENLG